MCSEEASSLLSLFCELLEEADNEKMCGVMCAVSCIIIIIIIIIIFIMRAPYALPRLALLW